MLSSDRTGFARPGRGPRGAQREIGLGAGIKIGFLYDKRLLARPAYEFGTLWWNLHGVTGYVRENPGLVNFARRHHKGLPVSSSIAESSVNQVVSLRMAKKRRMRWSDEGAHLLAQVRVQDINGGPQTQGCAVSTEASKAGPRSQMGRLHVGSRVSPPLWPALLHGCGSASRDDILAR